MDTQPASEIIDIFKNDASKPYLEFEVRNGRKYFVEYEGGPISTGLIIHIYGGDIYKSFKGNGVLQTEKVIK